MEKQVILAYSNKADLVGFNLVSLKKVPDYTRIYLGAFLTFRALCGSVLVIILVGQGKKNIII